MNVINIFYVVRDSFILFLCEVQSRQCLSNLCRDHGDFQKAFQSTLEPLECFVLPWVHTTQRKLR